MSYLRTLKQLRNQMLEGATKAPQQAEATNPFISIRQGSQAPQNEQTEDLLARSAEWLSKIKAKADQTNASAPKESETGVASAIKAFSESADRSIRERDEKAGIVGRRLRGTSPDIELGRNRPVSKVAPIPEGAPVKKVLDALAAVESRGSGDYAAVGPVVQKGMYKGERAYGRYQVMEGNIGPWTKKALGKSLTKDEFMADPAAQDAVAASQLQAAKDKFGTWEDAASVWFSGRPLKTAGNASDGHMNVPDYVNKFRKHYIE